MTSPTLSPTQEQLKAMFDYIDGKLVWKVKRKRVNVGDLAGVLHPNGYLRTGLNGHIHMNHRLIFMWHHGYLPVMVDHIDGNKLNNKIENLRPADKNKNQHNQKLKVTNTSGFKNVSLCPQTKKWKVSIKLNGKDIMLGRFANIELADLVAQEARAKYHGEYARNH
jgi:hypothetical protein